MSWNRRYYFLVNKAKRYAQGREITRKSWNYRRFNDLTWTQVIEENCWFFLGNLWINSLVFWQNMLFRWIVQNTRLNFIQIRLFHGFLTPISWYRIDCPYIRLRKVFGRQSQANIDLYKRIWHIGDTHSSSARDIPFSCSQTDTLWFEMRVLPCSEQKICDFRCSVPSWVRCRLFAVSS